MSLAYEDITRPVIGAAIAVHCELGPGFLESIYEAALAVELRERGIVFQRQVSLPVIYRGVEVGMHRLDMLVADEIVVELKACREITDAHFAVVRSYLRALRHEHGLILNFAKPKLEARRVFGPPQR